MNHDLIWLALANQNKRLAVEADNTDSHIPNIIVNEIIAGMTKLPKILEI